MRGELTNYVAGGPSNVDEVELVGVHVQVFFHAGHVGVGDASLGEVFDEVAKGENCEEGEIEFLDEFTFGWGAGWVVVLCSWLLTEIGRVYMKTYPNVRPPWCLLWL